MDIKKEEAQELIDDTNSKVAKVSEHTQTVIARANEYESILTKIEQASNEHTENLTRKNVIPNLLSHIMASIPKQVQLTSIRNTTGKTIQIEAQSKGYPYLGYFIAKLKEDAILLNVSSSESVKSGDNIKITITGDLPY